MDITKSQLKRCLSEGGTSLSKNFKSFPEQIPSSTSIIEDEPEMKSRNIKELGHLIMNTTKPLLIKNMLNWDILKWDFDKWEEVLSNEQLEFRCGKNCHTNEPQWEVKTEIINGKLSDVQKNSSADSDKWIYFDYKYLKHYLLDIKELRESISWDAFGLPDVTVDDCALWIGSKGAHTSLHADTYGCNLIAQVYGRKLWVLFPPDTDVKETRVPYEESSVYSKHNLFSPDVLSAKDMKNCRKVVLNPGEVLVLPWKWWHYVENLEPAISINAWLPLPQDDEQRLKESIIQMLMIRMTSNLGEEEKATIINPNMRSNMDEESPTSAFQMINRCKDICLANNLFDEDHSSMSDKPDIEEIIRKCDNIQVIPTLPPEEFRKFLEKQANRFERPHRIEEAVSGNGVISIINAITHSDVISLVKQKILED